MGDVKGQKEISEVSDVWFCVSKLCGLEPYQRLQGKTKNN